MQKAVALALALATFSSPMAAAAQPGLSAISPRFMSFGAEQDAPRGFTAMCAVDSTLCEREERAGAALAFQMSVPDASLSPAVQTDGPDPTADALAAIALPPLDIKQWRTVNRHVNAHVRQISDESAYGEGEVWRASGAGPNAVGDCEDLALQKMVELRAAGYPASSLMLAVAYQRRIGLHTVLVVRTQMGDYVLDNMSWAVKPWSKVKYSWLSVQSPDDPSRWHRLS